MAEMPNVVMDEVVESEWGNEIRDRTLQRYATVTERATLHPSPVEGDLAYMKDADIVLVYNGTAWVPIAAGAEVDGSTQLVGPVGVTSTLAVVLTLNLTIPTSWVSWRCEAYGAATFQATSAGGSVVAVIVGIDGTDGLAQAASGISGSANFNSAAPGFRRAGLTTTGSRAITLKAQLTGAGGGALSNLYLYARAVRTT